MACGILVPQSGIEPVLPEVEARCLNNWTEREVPHLTFLCLSFLICKVVKRIMIKAVT